MNEKPLETFENVPVFKTVQSRSGRAQFQDYKKKNETQPTGGPLEARCATPTAEAITTELGRLDNFQRLFAMIKYVFRAVRSLN